MEKNEYSQLELFNQQNDYGTSKTQRPGGSFLRRIRAYEKAVLIIIVFITIAIISFSLGLEKGKKIASSSVMLPERSALPRNEAPALGIEPTVQKQEVIEANPDLQNSVSPALVKKEQSKSTNVKGYTVQLASYKSESYAKKEAELLKKRGLSPLVLTKGDYVVLCVGSFPSRSAAEALLTKLKKEKRYSGCLIRRI